MDGDFTLSAQLLRDLLAGFKPGPDGPPPALLLLLALALDWLTTGFGWLWRILPHPVAWIGALIGWLERRLNRPFDDGGRSIGVLRLRGALTVLIVVGLAAGAGWAIAHYGRLLPYGWLIELFFATVLLAQRSLFVHVRLVAKALHRNGIEGGRAAVRHIVGRDVASLDEYGVARAAVESGAENFSDAVVAPVVWYLLLGLPGMAAYKAINTLDSMIGYRTARYEQFGKVAARLDDAANFVPARIAALLIALAAIAAPTANPWRALVTTLRDARKHRSPNAGWPEAAMAGALDLALAGPRPYHGQLQPGPWIGSGRARVTPHDINRALYLYAVACLLTMAAVAAAALI
ncbi:MAG TPA: adenosylcobinamide-phosphate synthase CbiB [Alphaproteobacteria bacterium]|nr:adenosylcobinamide-phosphate synthase CbiB [Alphaproteobacteria bacterium]